jgi:hypothetical protein
VDDCGPLHSANDELNFAGCVYTAVHFGAARPLRQLVRPLALPGWARPVFAVTVAREALTQAAVEGHVATCKTLLEAHGPAARHTVVRLGPSDACVALQAAEEWDMLGPDPVDPQQRAKVSDILRLVC